MGTRLGSQGPKALIEVCGKPLLVWTLGQFAPLGLVDDAIIVIPTEMHQAFRDALRPHFPQANFRFVAGGAERQHSVGNGIAAVDPDTRIVVVHDAARPFVPTESVRQSILAAEEFGAATVAIPSVDTILVGDANAFLIDTPDRSTLWACQTPQTFEVDVVRAAHEAATRDGFVGTDDASVVRRAGGRVKLVLGSPLNIKITTLGDLDLAKAILTAGIA